jgi:hypothetical protein
MRIQSCTIREIWLNETVSPKRRPRVPFEYEPPSIDSPGRLHEVFEKIYRVFLLNRGGTQMLEKTHDRCQSECTKGHCHLFGCPGPEGTYPSRVVLTFKPSRMRLPAQRMSSG